MELLVGLIQEIFLLSVSLRIIVDAINHLIDPIHVQDSRIIIFLGLIGILIGNKIYVEVRCTTYVENNISDIKS